MSVCYFSRRTFKKFSTDKYNHHGDNLGRIRRTRERKLLKNNGLSGFYDPEMDRQKIVHVLKYNILPCPCGHAILILLKQLPCTSKGPVIESSGSQFKKYFCSVSVNFVYDSAT